MRLLIIVISASFIVSSCATSVQNPIPATQPPVTTTQNSGAQVQPPLTESLSGANDEYDPIFNGIETKKIHIVHHTGKTTTVAFINSEAKAVDVNIEFASGGNLRLSQIIAPDGTMDGPF